MLIVGLILLYHSRIEFSLCFHNCKLPILSACSDYSIVYGTFIGSTVTEHSIWALPVEGQNELQVAVSSEARGAEIQVSPAYTPKTNGSG